VAHLDSPFSHSGPLSQSDRLSPAALVFAVLLHVALAAGLYWLAPFRPFKPAEDVIEVTVDKGGSPPAEQVAADPEPPQPASPQALAVPQPTPPAPEPERPKPEPPRVEQPPPPEPPPPDPPKPEPPKQVVEDVVPPPEPPPAPTAMDFPKPAPPPAPSPPPPAQQPQRAQPQPQRPPTRPPAAEQAARPAPSPLQNPTDVIIGPSGPTQNEYFMQLHRKLAQHRYYPQSARDRHQEGRVVVRLVISRDGRLLDARVDRSSGYPAIDAAEVDAAKRAAPFPPLPVHVPGEAATFLIPVTYELR
jgi:protein TonB